MHGRPPGDMEQETGSGKHLRPAKARRIKCKGSEVGACDGHHSLYGGGGTLIPKPTFLSHTHDVSDSYTYIPNAQSKHN